MSHQPDIRGWFAIELNSRGLGGLESVYDYVATLSVPSEIRAYLISLLGESASTSEFISSYLRRRGKVSSGFLSGVEAGEGSMSQPLDQEQDEERGNVGNIRMGKEKARTEGRGRRGRARVEDGFAGGKVMGSMQRTVDRAEEGRIRMRKWMKEGGPGRIVNCLRCGRVHRVEEVNRDGRCLFCGRAFFEEWNEPEDQNVDESSREAEQLRGNQTRRDTAYDKGAEIDPWLSPSEKKEANKRKELQEENKKKRTVTIDIDLANKHITETIVTRNRHSEPDHETVTEEQEPDQRSGAFVNPYLGGKAPLYIQSQGIDWQNIMAEAKAADVSTE